MAPLNETRERTYLFGCDYTIYNIIIEDHYTFSLFHGAITTLLAVHCYATTDVFLVIIVEHCCGLFEGVGYVPNTYEEKKIIGNFKERKT